MNDTRYAEQGLLIWSDNAVKDYYLYIQNNWDKTVLSASGSTWKELLQKGDAMNMEELINAIEKKNLRN